MAKSPVVEKLEKFFMSVNKSRFLKNIRAIRKSKSYIASILIHHRELSLVVMKYTGSYHVEKIIRETIPDEWYDDQKTYDENFSPFIKSLCQKHKLKKMPAVLISDNTDILPRIITVPKRSAKWTAHYLQQEVKKYVLFSGKDVKINWKIIETIEQDGKPHYRVFVIAITSELYDRWNKRFKKSGLYLKGISTHSLGLEYVIEQNYKNQENPPKSQIIVSIEPNQTLSFYMLNGKVHALHVIPITASNILSDPESLEYLEQVIKKTNRNLPNCPIVYYCSCRIPKKEKALANALSMIDILPVNHEALLSDITIDKNVEYALDMYVTAVGAGEMSADNLLLVDLSQGKPYLDVLIGYFMITMGLISVIMLSVFFIFYSQTSAINGHMYEVKTELASLDKQYQTVLSLDRDIDLAKKLIKGRRAMLEGNPVFDADQFFKTLPNMLSDNVRIDKFKLNHEKLLVLTGEALGPDAVFNMLQEIKKSPYFINPELKEVIQDKKDKSSTVKFIIHAELGDENGDN